MIEQPLIATTMIFALIALGEAISVYTKARVPMLLTAMLGFLVCKWLGIFPPKILEFAQLPALGAILVGPVILHMGTIMPMHVLKKQWRAVVISLSGLLFAAILVLGIVTPIFGFEIAASGIGPISGGIIALLVTNERLTQLGLVSLIVVPTLVQALQGVVGMPLASYFMKQYVSKDFINRYRQSDYSSEKDEVIIQTTSHISLLNNNTIRLFIIFLLAAVGVGLGSITPIHYTLYCLTFGILALHFKLLPQNVLEQAKSINFMVIGIIFVVIGSMGSISPQDVLDNLIPVLSILALGTLGIIIGGFIASKFVKWDPNKGMPVALTALFGFPADYILCQEVARSYGENEVEEEAILQELVTPMLIGGFVTVTITSVFIATFVMSLI